MKSKQSEIQDFDARGNIIRQTDAAGFTMERTYDGLGRVKTETAPNGDQTFWTYQGDTVIITLPSGERSVSRYEGGSVVSTEVFDAQGNLLSNASMSYDPSTGIQKVIQGGNVTTTLMNAQGLPVTVQQGNTTVTYEYDMCGNCISTTDGEGKKTTQEFDALKRITKKILPDGSILTYNYDNDSNLIACILPNGNVWKASYDLMGRKISEERQSGNNTSEQWEFTYNNGLLTEKKDPMHRVHTYQYDTHGRVIQDSVEDWQRKYTYDDRGLLASVDQQKTGANARSSRVVRTYDNSGRVATETIFLNSKQLQHTRQTWGTSTRTLQVGDHRRDFSYQNGSLTKVTASNVDLSYAYTPSGSLKQKTTPFGTTTTLYNTTALPEKIIEVYPAGTFEQKLTWDKSGKMAKFSVDQQEKLFSYSLRGYLESVNNEKYEYDLGGKGTGVLTGTPHWTVTPEGLDAFGKIIYEVVEEAPISINYDPMGQVIAHADQTLEWSPWGQLLKVTDSTTTWEAQYDGLGRRLQTNYTQATGQTQTTTSYYDPEIEFQEIGIQYDNKTFWKIFGPSACEAVVDDNGATAYLSYNAMGALTKVMTSRLTTYITQEITPYGPNSTSPLINPDLTQSSSLAVLAQQKPRPDRLDMDGRSGITTRKAAGLLVPTP